MTTTPGLSRDPGYTLRQSMASFATALPGLYVITLGAVMYLALAAWYDPVPRRVIAIHATLVALILGPHLFFGRTLLPVSNLRAYSVFGFVPDTSAEENPLHYDLLVQHLPTTTAVRAAWSRCELPLRDDSVAGGIPLWADQQAQVLQPLMFVSILFPPERALVVVAALRLLLALSFTFLFLRLECRSVQGALAGSVAFGLGGFVQLWLGWPLSSVAAWMPVVLYGLRRVEGSAGRRDAVLLVAAMYGLLTAGHPETVAYALAFALAYSTLLLVRVPAARRMRVAFAIIAPLAIGGALTAPLNLPSIRAIAVSERSLALAFVDELRDQTNEVPDARPVRLASVFAPEAFGNNRFGRYWGDSNINEDGSGYAGSAALVLGLLVFANRPRDRIIAFLLVWLAMCLLVISAAGPFGWIVSNLPILSTSATNGHRLLLLVNWIVAWLVARGVADAEKSPTGRFRAVVVAVMLASSIAAIYWFAAPASVTATVASRRTTMLVVQLSAIVIAAIASTLRSRGVAGAIIVATIAVELMIAHMPANPPARAAVPNSPPLLAALREKAEGWRVQASRSAIRANLGSLYGIRQIESSNPITPASWFTIIFAIPRATSEIAMLDAEAWLDALGTRYLVRPRAEVDASREPALVDNRSAVIERPTALPLFRFAGEASVAPSGSLVDLLYLPPGQRRQAIARRAAELGEDVYPWLLANPPRGGRVYVADERFWSDDWRPIDGDAIELRGRSPARLSFAARSRGPRLLATTEVDDGGWTALANGRTVATEKVNGAFVGVRIPAGASRVELRYLPPGFAVGVAVGLAAIASFIALLIAWPRLRTG